MARDHARIYAGIWRDDDWRSLEAGPQRLYFVALTQAELSLCGVVDFSPRRWARFAIDTDPASIEADAETLVATHFVEIDHDEEELWIRTFLRHDGVLRSPNTIVGMTRDFAKTRSAVLRQSIVEFLGSGFVAGLDPDVQKRVAVPFLNAHRAHFRGQSEGASLAPSQAPSEAPSQGVPEGLREPLPDGLVQPLMRDQPLHPSSPQPPRNGVAHENGGLSTASTPSGALRVLVESVIDRIASEELEAEQQRKTVYDPAAWLRKKRERLMATIARELGEMVEQCGLTDVDQLVFTWRESLALGQLQSAARSLGENRAHTDGYTEEEVATEAASAFGPDLADLAVSAFRRALSTEEVTA